MAIPKDVKNFIAKRQEADRLYNDQNRRGAHEWVKRGGWVIPIVPGKDKKPYVTWDQAVNTPEGINAFWDDYSTALVGIHTERSHYVAFDFDQKHGGMESFKRLAALYPEMLNTYMEKTRSGGVHLVYMCFNYPIKTGANAFKTIGYPGIDIRAKGGILVVAPSIDDLGEYTRSNDLEPTELPESLIKLLDSVCYVVKPEIYDERPNTAISIPFNEASEASYPPCIKEMLRVARAGDNHLRDERAHGLNHSERVALATFLKLVGMPKERVIEVFQDVPDYNRKTTEYQVGWIFDHDNYKCAKCATMRAYDICHCDETCGSCGSPIYYYKEHFEKQVADLWHDFTMADAIKDRPPIQYAVEGIIPLPSLIVPYGAPGSLKSYLIADMCVCIAAGLEWLAPVTTDLEGKPVTDALKAFAVVQCPITWVDFDNGERKTHDRFKTLFKGHGLDPDDVDSCQLHYYSMPDPALDCSKVAEIEALKARVKRQGSKILVLDNLAMVSGDVEENKGEMKKIMFNLRRLSEELQIAIIVIHHERKGGSGNNGSRAGEGLRGHSSIEGAIDLALHVVRESVENREITMMSTKTRGDDVPIFAARFTFMKDQEAVTTHAMFYRIPVKDKIDAGGAKDAANALAAVGRNNDARRAYSDAKLKDAIICSLRKRGEDHSMPTGKDLVSDVQALLKDDKRVSSGKGPINDMVNQLEIDGIVTHYPGPGNSAFWELNDIANNPAGDNGDDVEEV